MDNDEETLSTALLDLLGVFNAELHGRRAPKPHRAPKPFNPGKVVGESDLATLQAGELLVKGVSFGTSDVVSKAYLDGPAVEEENPSEESEATMAQPENTVGTPVPADHAKDIQEVREINRRLTRRVAGLEDSQRSVGCLKATIAMAAICMLFFALVVGSTLVLAYAEHRWEVPVFTRIFTGR